MGFLRRNSAVLLVLGTVVLSLAFLFEAEWRDWNDDRKPAGSLAELLEKPTEDRWKMCGDSAQYLCVHDAPGSHPAGSSQFTYNTCLEIAELSRRGILAPNFCIDVIVRNTPKSEAFFCVHRALYKDESSLVAGKTLGSTLEAAVRGCIESLGL